MGMNVARSASLLLAFVCCAACVAVQYNGADTTVSHVDYPDVGKVVTANVGDQLVAKGTVAEEKVLVIRQTIDGVGYKIPAGTYKQLGYDAKRDFYSAVGVIKGVLADPFQALSVDKGSGAKICVVSMMGAETCYDGDYERKTRFSERGDSFQQTLIYSGRVGNKINIGYREFSNNLARPAFNNDVEYDLSTSHTIGYKGAQLDVINADNNSITYKLLKNFP